MSSSSNMAQYVRALARGPGRARHLTRQEAAEAMALMLSGDAQPEATGALLMLMRYRGENADEIAGFVDTLRTRAASWRTAGAAIDWPSYAAGRSRGAPWFLLSAELVAAAGYPVLLHGWNAVDATASSVRAGADALGIPTIQSVASARQALARRGIAYAPIEAIDADAYALLRLRDVLGVRSPLNTALRAWNPVGATTSLQGVFHPSYRGLQHDVAVLLGQANLAVLKGGGGEFERHPSKAVELFGLHNGVSFDMALPPLVEDKRRLGDASIAEFIPVWRGERHDAFAEAIVIGAAGAALLAVGAAHALPAAEALARDLWQTRSFSTAA